MGTYKNKNGRLYDLTSDLFVEIRNNLLTFDNLMYYCTINNN